MRPKVSATPTCETAPPLTLSITIAPVPANTRQKVPKNSANNFFGILSRRKTRENSGLQFHRAVLFAEVLNLSANFFQQFARFRQPLFVRSAKLRGIGKRPVQPLRYPGENRAAFRLRFTANGDRIRKQLTRFEDVENRLCFVGRDVGPNFLERFNSQRVQRSWFESGTLRFEKLAAHFVEQRCSDLAARAVMNANEKNPLLHRPNVNRSRTQIEAIRGIVTRTSHCARQHHADNRAFVEFAFRLHAPAV